MCGSLTSMGRPVIVDASERAWETWPDAEGARRGGSRWKTLISAHLTPSEALTLGVSKLPPGEASQEHRHAEPEVYLVLAGTGVVTIDGEARPVGPGTAVFIPGNAPHSCESTGASDLEVVYVFAADSFEDIEYVFSE